MQNTSEISHPGNKQNSLCPWEANTGGRGKPLMDKGHSREWQIGLSMIYSRMWLSGSCLVLVLLHGVWNHSTALFESKIKKTKNNKKKKKQHSLQPWPPSCEYLLTRWIFIRQKASSNNSLEMDKHWGQALPAGFRHFSACIPWTVQPSQERLSVPRRWLGHSSQCHIIDVVLTAFREVNVGGENSHRVVQLFPLARHTP